MLAPFLIMLREGLEAALIVGIIAGYLRQTGRAQWLPAIWVGVFLAVALALFAGAGLQMASAQFPQKTQELIEALIGFVAVAVLIGMVFWMKRAARSIKSTLHASVDQALAQSRATWGLIGMVFLAVAREGLESVFFFWRSFSKALTPARLSARLWVFWRRSASAGASMRARCGWIWGASSALPAFSSSSLRRGCSPARSRRCTRPGCGTAC